MPLFSRRHIDEQLRGLVVALFMPIFFSLAGLHADLTILGNPTLFFLTIGLIWGRATVSLSTKKIKGLHENDFIMASKIDRMFSQ
jgi:Kef-type K+ transport system membrane component KefB